MTTTDRLAALRAKRHGNGEPGAVKAPKYRDPDGGMIMGDSRIIGLTGLAGAGKTSAARWLERNMGYTVLPFSAPLKAMAGVVLRAEQLHGVGKEVPLEVLCGLTPRQFMQRLGTEFGRDQVGQDFWIGLWFRAARALPQGARIVADDVRFLNEAATIRAAGGVIIEMARPGAGSASGADHVSEALPVAPDWRIEARDLAALERQVAGLFD